MKELTEIQKRGIRRKLAMFERNRRAREESRPSVSSQGDSGPPGGRPPGISGGVLFLGQYIQNGHRGSGGPVHISEVVKELFREAGRRIGNA